MNKKIYDPIHKYMSFEPILVQIIDTVEFQRLRNIKQLGFCYYVFSGANHNRFEHSLGVAHLCGLLLTKIKHNQPELNITDRQIILIKIAGLVHDIGHGCFSHFFDNYLLNDSKHINSRHEIRSQLIFQQIVKKYKLKINNDEINFLNNLIDPNNDNNDFIYQILSNKENSIDCDKFDYLLRDTFNLGLPFSFDCNRFIENAKVINNKLCYSIKLYYDIYDLFNLRFRLHKQIYNHHTVNQLEHMVLDIINLVDDKYNIKTSIHNINNFIEISDSILDKIYYSESNDKNIIKAKEILYNIKIRKLYKMVEEIMLDTKQIPNELKLKYNNFETNYCYSIIVINYTKQDKNPLDSIHFYDNKNNKFFIKKNKLNVSINNFQEIILRIFKKN